MKCAVKVLYIAMVFAMFCTQAGISREFPMLHYTKENGLPSNTVYNIRRDHQGFFWIATDKGVARYNGLKFEVFTTFNGLPCNEVFLFQEDVYGRLWMGTYNGELCYYKDGKFHTKKNTPFLDVNCKIPHIWTIGRQPDSSVIIMFNTGSTFLDIKNEKISIRNLGINHEKDPATYINKISNNNYQIISAAYKTNVDSNGNIINKEKINHYIFPYTIRHTSGQQNLIFTNECVYSTDMKVLKKNIINFSKFIVHDVLLNTDVSLYGTDKGLFVNDTIKILNNIQITSIIQDNEKNYWISTNGYGIYILGYNFLTEKLYKQAYSGKIKYAVAQNDNIYFMTTAGLLFRLRSDAITNLIDFNKYMKVPISPTKLSSYYLDDSGRFFFTYENSLILFENQFKNAHITTLSGRPKDIFAIKNDIYVRYNMGGAKIHINKIIGKRVEYTSKLFSSAEKIFGFAKTDNNQIWYSTLNNIYTILNNTDSNIIENQFKKIAVKSINFFNNYLIGCTHDNQLLIYENFDKNDVTIDTVELNNFIVDNIYKINDNNLLLPTNSLYQLLSHNNHGLKKFSLKAIENPFLPLDAEYICMTSNNCYFFKDGDITVFNKNDILKQQPSPELFFSNIATATNRYNISDTLAVTYKESEHISVHFTTLLLNGTNITYQYSVSKNKSYDNWRDISAEEINLIRPGYGTYTIKVRAKTLSSDYSQPITFTLHILKPFWATWWFMTLSICAFLIVVGIIIRYRIRYIVRKNERLHESEVKLMKLEYKALNALMNPHFIFNSLNNMQALVNKNEKLAANKYLSIFANLIRRNMHNISLELIPLSEEMEVVAGYLKLEKLRFKDLLGYEINIADEVDTSEIMIPPLLVQPLVENSIKHGLFPRKSTESCVKVDIYEQDNRLVIAVKDNGIGMEAASKKVEASHQSYGLDNIRKRLEQLSIIQNRQISLNIGEEKDSSDISWTVVTITISLS